MPSYLGEFPGCMPNREATFVSAVESFLNCNYCSELIVVSDGCKRTIDILNKKYKYEIGKDKIIPVITHKHELFDGEVRQIGLNHSTGDWIAYLDSDDLLAPHHLANLAACVEGKDLDWVYFNAFWYLKELNKQVIPFIPELKRGSINTGCIAHRKGVNARWDGFIGKQENWHFIEQLLKNHPDKYKYIAGCGYLIQHAEVKKMEKA